VASQSIERLVHIAGRRLAYHPLRLFDDYATIERVTQLGVQRSGVDCRTMLKNGNRRDIGETLSHDDVIISECSLMSAKEVERANRSTA
jgi:hypothetical protein